MEHNNIYNGNRTAEAMPMTCGMSDELLQSDLLSRISVLSLNDKQCLIRYICEEVEADQMGEEDPWETQDTSDLEPYTLEELYARIEESEEQIRRGEYQTEEEVREEMRKEFPWLINKIYRNYLTKDLPQLVTKF